MMEILKYHKRLEIFKEFLTLGINITINSPVVLTLFKTEAGLIPIDSLTLINLNLL